MKDILLLALAILLAIALFADGGLEISPTVSPSLKFSPSVDLQYNPSTTTIERQTNIGTNIEHQTVVVQPVQVQPMPNGVTLVDPAFRLCQPLPGETITSGPDTKGACFVQDAAGNKFFLNAAGSRWPLAATPGGITPLQPQAADLSLDELQAAYLRNGGELPILWDFRSEAGKIEFLKARAETWR